MPKAAIIVLADTGTPEGTGRMANALTTAKEFKDAGADALVIFDGAGTRWVPELADPEYKYHRLRQDVRDHVGGACVYCAGAYGVKDQIEEAGIPFLAEYHGHPSLRDLMSRGYQILTF